MATAISPEISLVGDHCPTHLYSLCFFGPGQIVPAVELIEALDDEDAILLALEKRPSLVRELWDRHRFVARLNGRGKVAAD